MYNHLSSVINFLQNILSTFMSRDTTRNKHVNRERKKIIYSTWYETILISSMIRAVPTTFVHSCWHNIKQVCYHAWYELSKQHCSRLLVHQPWTVLFEQAWRALLTTMFTGCSTTLFTSVPNSTACSGLLTTCSKLSVFTREELVADGVQSCWIEIPRKKQKML